MGPAQGRRAGVLRDLIQIPASELPRIPIPRTPVNKGLTSRKITTRRVYVTYITMFEGVIHHRFIAEGKTALEKPWFGKGMLHEGARLGVAHFNHRGNFFGGRG